MSRVVRRMRGHYQGFSSTVVNIRVHHASGLTSVERDPVRLFCRGLSRGVGRSNGITVCLTASSRRIGQRVGRHCNSQVFYSKGGTSHKSLRKVERNVASVCALTHARGVCNSFRDSFSSVTTRVKKIPLRVLGL